MTVSHTGGCLCGAIRYTLSAPVTALRACHCTDCQKSSGSGSSVNAVVPGSAFELTRGTLKSHAVKADSGRTLIRYFCGDCGSPIYARREDTLERIAVRAGSFDDTSSMKITANIWTKSARPWSHIDPDAEQLPGNPA